MHFGAASQTYESSIKSLQSRSNSFRCVSFFFADQALQRVIVRATSSMQF